MDLHSLTLHEAQQRLVAGDLTAVRLTEAVLERIDSVEPTVRAFLSLDRQGALRQAEAADAAHVRAFEEAQFGEASADAIVDSEYYDDLAAAWSLVAGEHQLISPDAIFAHDGSVH